MSGKWINASISSGLFQKRSRTPQTSASAMSAPSVSISSRLFGDTYWLKTRIISNSRDPNAFSPLRSLSLRGGLELGPEIAIFHLVEQGAIADLKTLGSTAAVPVVTLQCAKNNLRFELLRSALYLLLEGTLVLLSLRRPGSLAGTVVQLGDDLVGISRND